MRGCDLADVGHDFTAFGIGEFVQSDPEQRPRWFPIVVDVVVEPTVASTVVGASSVAQLKENLGALDHLEFTPEDLSEIDRFASDSGIDLWRESSDL